MTKKSINNKLIAKDKFKCFLDEPEEWLKLTPGKRMEETSKLWQFYLSVGGNLDPEPNPQSPFYFQET